MPGTLSDNTIQRDPPRRVVSLSPSNTEILFAVGAGEKVVGVTDYCNYPIELLTRIEKEEIQQIGGYWNPSIKKIIELKPDIILVSVAKCDVKTNECKENCSRRCELTQKIANKLESLGFKVLRVSPHSLEDVLGNIIEIGDLTGKSCQALKLVRDLRKRIGEVVDNSMMKKNRPRVYFEVWNDPYISVNSNTWIGNMINLAGGSNVFEDEISEWPIINSEIIIKKNPEIMFFPVIPGIPRFWGSFNLVKKRLGWDCISAIKNDQLYEILRDCISRPSPRLVDSLELLGKLIQELDK
jgi:iron complex transport system substrate-binding protein